MRRWLALLLLALLPLQFSWAAVAAYCGHETGGHEAAGHQAVAQAQHLGHHPHQHAHQHAHEPAHQHAGQPGGADHGAAADQDAAAAGFDFDFDCGHCHGTCASLGAPVDAPAPPTRASRPATPADDSLRTLAPRPPERPQWRPLA